LVLLVSSFLALLLQLHQLLGLGLGKPDALLRVRRVGSPGATLRPQSRQGKQRLCGGRVVVAGAVAQCRLTVAVLMLLLLLLLLLLQGVMGRSAQSGIKPVTFIVIILDQQRFVIIVIIVHLLLVNLHCATKLVGVCECICCCDRHGPGPGPGAAECRLWLRVGL
jgi:hypothetical protein